MRRLKIYNDQNHPHQAQNPIEIDISNFHSNPNFNVELTKLFRKVIFDSLDTSKSKNTENNYNDLKFMNSKMELSFQKKNIGLGRRKQAIARVFLIPGEGNLIINNKPGDKYLTI
jgi:hypothetical protein